MRYPQDPSRRREEIQSPIHNFLNDDQDSALARRIAQRSTLPDATKYVRGNYVGTEKPNAATSMLMSGSDNLAGLTDTTSLSSPASVATSMGNRALESRARVLVSDGNQAIQIAPLEGNPVYECPFSFILCFFNFSSINDWSQHTLTHFRGVPPPQRNKCCFCEDEWHSQNGKESWKAKLEHLAVHFHLGHRLAHARPDFGLHRYMWEQRLMRDEDYWLLLGHSSRASQSHTPRPTGTQTPRAAPGSDGIYTITSNNRQEERRRRHGNGTRRA
jgi:hypothetical protein